MFIALNRSMRRLRRQVVMAAGLFSVVVTVIAAHSAPGGAHMADDGQMSGAMAMCLAVGETVAAALIAVALLRVRARGTAWFRDLAFAQSPGMVIAGAMPVRARDGPALQVFLN